ncbi:MAG: hypothetical protein WCQ99_05435 [Pseudomonadota bacterium]
MELLTNDKVNAPRGRCHGDELILFCMPYIRHFLKKHQDLVLIEIGSERKKKKGGSTHQLAMISRKRGWQFITVDADDAASRIAGAIVKSIDPVFEAHHRLGEEFLKEYSKNNIGICYLDAFDIVTEGSRQEIIIKTYERRHVAMTNQAAYAMHYAAAVHIVDKIIPGGFICFDDVWLDKHAVWQGKGKTAIPLLLSRGYKIIEYTPNALLLQNLNGLDIKVLASGTAKKKWILLGLKILRRRVMTAPVLIKGLVQRRITRGIYGQK